MLLSARIQASALMGLIQGSDYESLQQALGPDCKSVLGCDFFDASACKIVCLASTLPCVGTVPE